MDKAERTGDKLGIILLDWEKAFDKITHSSLVKTLEIFKLDPHLIHMVKAVYKHPSFEVNINGKCSNTKTQNLIHKY